MSAGQSSARRRIELPVGLCLVAGFVGVGTALAFRRSTPVEPGLVVTAGTLDFGSVWEQPAYRHVFAVSNPTDAPIRVTEFTTGCGCTTVEPRTFSVPPGGTQQLTATLDLTHRAGDAGAEFVVELLPKLGHQPPGGRTVWTLRGDVRTNPIELSEPVVDFGDTVIANEPPPTIDVEVALADGVPYESLQAVATGDAAGNVALDPLGPRRWTLAISPRDDLPTAPFEFAVRLEASGGRQPSEFTESPNNGQTPFHDIKVRGTVRDDLSAWPRRVNFGALEIGAVEEEYVVLASHTGAPFEVERIETPPGITVEPAPQEFEDGSRTFVIRQRAAKQDNKEKEVAFHLRRGENLDDSFAVKLPVSYYGIKPATRPVTDTRNPPSTKPDESKH